MKAIVYHAPRDFSYQDCLQYSRMGEQVTVYGVYAERERVTWSPTEIFRREITIKGSFTQTHCFDCSLLYLESGKVKADEIVPNEFAPQDYGKELEALRGRVGN